MRFNFHTPKGEPLIYGYFDNEPKHKKKKNKKSTPRAKHKHKYEKVALVSPDSPFMEMTIGYVCLHCGRVANWSLCLSQEERNQLVDDIYDNKIRFVEWKSFDKKIDVNKFQQGGPALEKIFEFQLKGEK